LNVGNMWVQVYSAMSVGRRGVGTTFSDSVVCKEISDGASFCKYRTVI
jgi:hypothetical protein